MKKVIYTMMLGSALIFASCGGDAEDSEESKDSKDEKKTETVADYADKFCECMKEKGEEECRSIIEEAQEKFPDGRKDFEERMKECDIEM